MAESECAICGLPTDDQADEHDTHCLYCGGPTDDGTDEHETCVETSLEEAI